MRMTPARAPVFCSTTTGQLQSALILAEPNAQDDEIRIEQGIYAVPEGSSLTAVEQKQLLDLMQRFGQSCAIAGAL